MCNQCNDSNKEHVHAVPSRREVLIAGAALVAAPFLGGVTSIVQAVQAPNTRGPVGRPLHAQAGGRPPGTGPAMAAVRHAPCPLRKSTTRSKSDNALPAP